MLSYLVHCICIHKLWSAGVIIKLQWMWKFLSDSPMANIKNRSIRECSKFKSLHTSYMKHHNKLSSMRNRPAFGGGILKQKRHWLYHPLLLRAGGGSDVTAGKSWPGMLQSCDKAHILTAFVNSTQLINALVHGDGDVTEQKRWFLGGGQNAIICQLGFDEPH